MTPCKGDEFIPRGGGDIISKVIDDDSLVITEPEMSRDFGYSTGDGGEMSHVRGGVTSNSTSTAIAAPAVGKVKRWTPTQTDRDIVRVATSSARPVTSQSTRTNSNGFHANGTTDICNMAAVSKIRQNVDFPTKYLQGGVPRSETGVTRVPAGDNGGCLSSDSRSTSNVPTVDHVRGAGLESCRRSLSVDEGGVDDDDDDGSVVEETERLSVDEIKTKFESMGSPKEGVDYFSTSGDLVLRTSNDDGKNNSILTFN